MRPLDITGQHFGRLTALERRGTKWGGSNWLCKCDCGNTKEYYLGNLTSGNTVSCGCYKKEVSGKYRRKTNTRENNILRYYRRNAKVREQAWELSNPQAEIILHGPCEYCGKKPALGIDRVDNDRGYILGNVTPCCRRCNQAKNDMTFDEFRNWITKVYRYFVGE
jgi:hypothetical protein